MTAAVDWPGGPVDLLLGAMLCAQHERDFHTLHCIQNLSRKNPSKKISANPATVKALWKKETETSWKVFSKTATGVKVLMHPPMIFLSTCGLSSTGGAGGATICASASVMLARSREATLYSGSLPPPALPILLFFVVFLSARQQLPLFLWHDCHLVVKPCCCCCCCCSEWEEPLLTDAVIFPQHFGFSNDMVVITSFL